MKRCVTKLFQTNVQAREIIMMMMKDTQEEKEQDIFLVKAVLFIVTKYNIERMNEEHDLPFLVHTLINRSIVDMQVAFVIDCDRKMLNLQSCDTGSLIACPLTCVHLIGEGQLRNDVLYVVDMVRCLGISETKVSLCV
jgi:hypothetical protein